jgi:predicted permease
VNPVAKIRRGLKLQDADSQVAALAPQFDDRLQNAPGGGATSRLQPMDRYAVNGLMGKMRFVQDRRTVIFVIFGAGILVFIVGCANAANLFLSRSVSRTREAAVRAALGAGRLRLIRYFLAESLLIGLAGGAVGTLLASAGIRALLHVVPPNLIRDSLNPMHMNASIATGLIVGAMPAVRAFRNDITSAIRGGTAPARRDGRFRGVIVALEGALAMILLIGAGLTLRTLWTLIHVDPGWSASGTLIVEPKFTADRYRGAISMTELEKQTVAQTRLLPGVHAVALAAVVPLLNPSISFGTLESDAVSIPNATVAVNEITGDYFRTLGIPLIAGRSFQTEPAGPGGDDLHNVIVTRDMAARLWPEGNAVGQRLRFRYGPPDSNDWLMVIGVVGDVQTFAFDSPGEPIELYRILPASNRARWITVKTGSNATSREVRDIIRSLDPNLAVDIRSMDEIYDGTLAAPRFQTILFSGFAILTLCLAMSGLYAVVGYEAKRQTREIGIRIALGAGRWAVVGHVVRGFLLLCGLGIIGGMLAGLVLTRWMSAMIYAVRPNDPATFGIAAILLVLAALIGCFVPAYRASRANPAAVLRAD